MVRRSLLDSAQTVADTYPSIQWLWYTRRISHAALPGHLPTTHKADHALLEALSALSRGDDHSRRFTRSGRTEYRTDKASLRPVAQLAALAIVLGRTHSWLRRAGKLTWFTVYSDKFPEPVANETVEDAIDDFDQRIATWSTSRWLQGLQSVPDAVDIDDWLLLTFATPDQPYTIVPSWVGGIGTGELQTMLGQFAFHPMSLTDLRHTLSGSGDGRQWWPEELPALVALLQILMIASMHSQSSIGQMVPAWGYINFKRPDLLAAVAELLPRILPELLRLFPQAPSSAETLMDLVDGISAGYWPYEPGPILRYDVEDTIIVDIMAASRRLANMVTMPRTFSGKAPNAVAERFELYLQDGLDHSDWAPNEYLRSLRGRTLKLNGNDVTDIDAIGLRGSDVLLVSAKNYPYTPNDDSGDKKTIEKVEERIDLAAREWAKHVATLVANPAGANYSFDGYNLIGVVVTPTPLFSRDTATNAEHQLIPMRAVSGVSELFAAVNVRDAWRGGPQTSTLSEPADSGAS